MSVVPSADLDVSFSGPTGPGRLPLCIRLAGWCHAGGRLMAPSCREGGRTCKGTKPRVRLGQGEHRLCLQGLASRLQVLWAPRKAPGPGSRAPFRGRTANKWCWLTVGKRSPERPSRMRSYHDLLRPARMGRLTALALRWQLSLRSLPLPLGAGHRGLKKGPISGGGGGGGGTARTLYVEKSS